MFIVVKIKTPPGKKWPVPGNPAVLIGLLSPVDHSAIPWNWNPGNICFTAPILSSGGGAKPEKNVIPDEIFVTRPLALHIKKNQKAFKIKDL